MVLPGEPIVSVLIDQEPGDEEKSKNYRYDCENDHIGAHVDEDEVRRVACIAELFYNQLCIEIFFLVRKLHKRAIDDSIFDYVKLDDRNELVQDN